MANIPYSKVLIYKKEGPVVRPTREAVLCAQLRQREWSRPTFQTQWNSRTLLRFSARRGLGTLDPRASIPGRGMGKGAGDSCRKGECTGCYRCPGIWCHERNGLCSRCGGKEDNGQGGHDGTSNNDLCKCSEGWQDPGELACGCPECHPDEYEDVPEGYHDGYFDIGYQDRVCGGCEFCIGTYCGYTACKCPKDRD
jgi:hypothetical protein